MKSHSHYLVLTLLPLATWAASPSDSLSPHWKAGILLNLDAGGIPPSDLSRNHLPLELADAELGLGLQWRPEIGFEAVLVHEDGLATFQQAFATWTSPVATVAFGAQTLPLGIYAGRLIHDPLLQEDLETILPSVAIRREIGAGCLHLALGSEARPIDSAGDSPVPVAVAAVDWAWSDAVRTRLSGKAAQDTRLVDFGAEIGWSGFLLDLEGFAADGEGSAADFATLVGLTWNATTYTTLSVRFDGYLPRGEESWNRSVAFGGFQRFAEIAYAGAEWLQDLEGDGTLTLRCGLEVELESP